MPILLSLYFARRFLSLAMALFAIIFFLVYAADLIELLRRGADSAKATAGGLAYLAALRTPFVAEETFPFVVLFAAMAAFLLLSRRLELVSVRAAGVSAWQFIAPVALAAALVGALAIGLYNPAAALMKRQADALESDILGGAPATGGAVWIRQRGVDGQAIIHAVGRGADEGELTHVEIYEFDAKGDFQDRISGAYMRLEPLRWRIEDVSVASPFAPTTQSKTYFLATEMTPTDVAQALASPDTVPFWNLPAAASLAERAGVDSGPYRLRYQELLALPLLLAAMVLLAGCFSLRLFRLGGVGIMVSGGAFSGFVLYMVSKLSSEFGGAGLLGPLAAGWSPAILACVVGGTVLLYREDG
jgi:lipopolysaccharide export system permease protein